MKDIVGPLAPGEDDAVRGLAQLLCPCCGRKVREPDMERYYEEKGERSVELCCQCREDFESDFTESLTSDIIPADVFGKLWTEASASAAKQESLHRGLNDTTAPTVAVALGGEEWQSGGGIMLILFRRPDGRLVVLSDEVVCEYVSEGAFDQNKPDTRIRLR